MTSNQAVSGQLLRLSGIWQEITLGHRNCSHIRNSAGVVASASGLAAKKHLVKIYEGHVRVDFVRT